MGRKRSIGARVKNRLSRAKLSVVERNPPAQHIIARRALFAFVTPSKGPDGRGGDIDQDICDGIGQMQALGLLDGHGVDPVEMRDRARLFGDLWWNRYSSTAPKVGAYVRIDKGQAPTHETGDDRLFARMDKALTGYERNVVMSLCVDHSWSDEIVPWAAGLIAEGLMERGKVIRFIHFPTLEDRARLAALIRGLISLVQGRMERAA